MSLQFLEKTDFWKSIHGTVWYIFVISGVFGICIGNLCCLVLCFRRRRLRKRSAEENPAPQTTDVDTTYEEIDLTKMIASKSYEPKKFPDDEGDSEYEDLQTARNTGNQYYYNN